MNRRSFLTSLLLAPFAGRMALAATKPHTSLFSQMVDIEADNAAKTKAAFKAFLDKSPVITRTYNDISLHTPPQANLMVLANRDEWGHFLPGTCGTVVWDGPYCTMRVRGGGYSEWRYPLTDIQIDGRRFRARNVTISFDSRRDESTCVTLSYQEA